MEDYIMRKNYTVEQMAETRWFYTFTEVNAKGETLIIELSKCTNSGGNNALPILWYKNKMTDRVLETYWSIETYVRDTEGCCYGMYNPQEKLREDGKGMVINFDWMFETTEENKERLIDEVYRIFSTATGETATEEKYRKVREYAKEHNIEVLTEMPEGWFDLDYCSAPIGSTWIGSSKSFKDKNRKMALLILA